MTREEFMAAVDSARSMWLPLDVLKAASDDDLAPFLDWSLASQLAAIKGPLRAYVGRLWHAGILPAWAMCGVDLSGVDLSGVNIRLANLYGANLAGANLDRADLALAYFERANLAGASLRYAYAGSADLYGANLAGADLTGANLSGSYGANLDDAIVSDTNTFDAMLAGDER